MSMEYQIQLGAAYAYHGCKVDYAAKTSLVSWIKPTDMHVIANLVNNPTKGTEISQPLTSRGDVRLPVLIAKEMRRSRMESVLNKREH